MNDPITTPFTRGWICETCDRPENEVGREPEHLKMFQILIRPAVHPYVSVQHEDGSPEGYETVMCKECFDKSGLYIPRK